MLGRQVKNMKEVDARGLSCPEPLMLTAEALKKKELKLVITFHTTADAMAMEKECKKVGAQGRMIPVPRSISAGCGLSWCAPLECREELKNVMQGIGLEEEEIHECMV